MDLLKIILQNTKDIKNLKKQIICCVQTDECPTLSADIGNILECRVDGLYATGGGGGTLTDANNGLSVSGTIVELGQSVGAVGNPAELTNSREIPLGASTLSFLGGTTLTSFQDTFISHTTLSGNAGFFLEVVGDFPGLYMQSSSITDGPIMVLTNANTDALNIGISGNSDIAFIQANILRLIPGADGVRSNGNTYMGGNVSPTAILHIAQGSTTVAPLKLTSGSLLTTPETAAVEYNGTNLFFTRTGTTRESVFVGVSGAAAPSTTAGGTITNRYGGDTNFLGDPDSWASVVIAGTTYKIPLYI